ncbi:aspartate--tRNA ligase [Occallatibacter riparius]|uniref:Aspartate--tRNA(Asp/Asn) ligase n=2 Tax=Occallatibacter riparius TaxID=1002689 RepID=A0A9J7BZ31_9BACT|nr:aspartate--tRNA ligase [Occallatibacter riparius]
MCGTLRAADAGQPVVVMGWVNRRRVHGSLIFLDFRDRSGICQVVLDKEVTPEGHAKGEAVRPEYVVAALGKVRLRAADAINRKMETGEIEIEATELRVLNDSRLAPFSPAEDAIENEETRLKYRYLDLRREEMQRKFRLRHEITRAIRESMSEQGFLEVETPLLCMSTPEGARDFLVPSRVHPGQFYALPQSPQLFKQILMISGIDRYFQIARCFRDEDQRADRQLEFTQVDLEMSFPRQEHVFAVVEKFLVAAFAAAGIALPTPFPRITYDESLRRFGSDKPDMRLPEMTDVRAAFPDEALATLQIDPELPVVAFRIAAVGSLSREEREDNHPMFDKHKGAKFIDDFKRLAKGFSGAAAKVRELVGASDKDLVVIVAGDPTHHVKASDTKFEGRLSEREINVYAAAGNFRSKLARKYAERHKWFEVTESCVEEADPKSGMVIDGSKAFQPMWIADFPMFEYDLATKRWVPAHHPFTAPHEHDMANLESDPPSVRANYYDLAMNGLELGSGSIRIYRKDVQQVIFKALGISDEEAHERFGFFLDALEYGAPPHGGIALGLDRIVMLVSGAANLREVITFPKTANAIDLMAHAPATVPEQQLKELHIQAANG